ALAGPAAKGTPEARRKAFESVFDTQLEDLERFVSLPAGPQGQSVDIEWDPQTGSVISRIRLGEGQGEILLHGAAAGRVQDGRIAYEVQADPEPVTPLSAAALRDLKGRIFGVWTDAAGSRWMIRRPGADTLRRATADPNARIRRDIEAKRAELSLLERQQVHVWTHPSGGEVIQEGRIRRLPEPYRYDRERSAAFNRPAIERLRAGIAELRAQLDLKPVEQEDPRGRGRDGGGAPIEIDIWEKDGRHFAYDEAKFNGDRITASRTLRDMLDISDLPEEVIRQLIASWSPPEWVELAARLDPREMTLSLDGALWRMHVTYGGFVGATVKSIHTPYARPLRLTYRDDKVMLRIVDLDGGEIDTVRHDQPFRVEARFLEAPEGYPTLYLDREGEDTDQELTLLPLRDKRGRTDLSAYRTGILYAKTRRHAGREEQPGLYRNSRYVTEARLPAARAEHKRETDYSATISAKDYAGTWAVTAVTGRLGDDPAAVEAGDATGKAAGSGAIASRPFAGSPYIGEAKIAADGRSAWLVIAGKDGVWAFDSVEMKAVGEPGSDFQSLSIRFARSLAAEAEPQPGGGGLLPLPEGRDLYFPPSDPAIHFRLDDARTYAALELEPIPDLPFQITLAKRESGRLAGAWYEERPTGSFGAGGQQTWAREPKIDGITVLQDQRKRDLPTTAFYPFGADPHAGHAAQRTLFLHGKQLPVSYGDAIAVESRSDGVSYRHSYMDQMPPETIARAWQQAGVTDPEGHQGLFLTATFTAAVAPGIKRLGFNGFDLAWVLDFADNNGIARFTDASADRKPTGVLVTPTDGYLELETSAPIPYATPLPFELLRGEARIADLAMRKVTGEEAKGREDRLYRSPLLHFVDTGSNAPALAPAPAGAVTIDTARADGETAPVFKAQLKTSETEPPALLVAPVALRTVSDPDRLGETWQKALERAAACWTDPQVRVNPRAAIPPFSKFIFTEFGSRKIGLDLGDHAAVLLMRDEAGRLSGELAAAYSQTGADDKKRAAFISMGEQTGGASDAFWTAEEFVWDEVTYRASALLDLNALARQISRPLESARRFRDNRVRSLLTFYARAVRDSAQKSAAIPDCKIDELLVGVGRRAPSVLARLQPRLVKREGGEWVPDTLARSYLASLYVPGDAIRALEQYAKIDEAYQAMALALVGAGSAAALSRIGYVAAAATANLAADLADVAYFGVKGVLDYQQAEAFYDYSRGAAAVYGSGLYEEAVGARQSGLWAAAGVLLPGLGALSSVSELRHLGKIEEGARLARRLGTVTEASLAGLARAEKQALLAYLAEIRRATALAGQPGLRGTANRLLRGGGREVTDADRAVMAGWDAYAAARLARVDRGASIAARIDKVEPAMLARLSDSQRADLATWLQDIKTRAEVLRSGKFEGRIRGVSAREAELARQLESAGFAADAAAGGGRAGAA
ncbi:MAG: hypothetical protein RLO22_05950, partial [Sneathiellaceae bacterium]